MDSGLVTVPQISISPAPPEKPPVEPYSPFGFQTALPFDDDGFRSKHLTPPPTFPVSPKTSSSLTTPASDTSPPKGLERERFEALLRASRERNSKEGDLRKEIALKAHRTKQAERRALFLSKVLAPPSPTATLTPKTPPDSPAVFHYSLPSPGLVSPLALFETIQENTKYGLPVPELKSWVEQVDFRLSEQARSKPAHAVRILPSLDQISAHLRLQKLAHPQSPAALKPSPATLTHPSRRLALNVGRLRLSKVTLASDLSGTHPQSPSLPPLEIKTIVVPRSATVSPTNLTESNLMAFNHRERSVNNMLCTLRRRTHSTEHQKQPGVCPKPDVAIDKKSRWKRHSAPADLTPLHEREGFRHPVLAIPGGF